jgi:hypothetical protein
VTIRIPVGPNAPKGPIQSLMDVNVQPLIEKAAQALQDQLSVMVDSGIAPSGEAIPNNPATTARRLRAGSSTPGHRTGASARRWRRRQIKRGKREGNIVVELAPLDGFKNQLSAILGRSDITPSDKVMGNVNAAVEQDLAKGVEFRQTDGSMRPARR